MITFKNLSDEQPYRKLKNIYDKALQNNQKFIEAILISSFSHETNEVDSRFVNLKFIDNKEFIFFSNLRSPKAKQFKSHDQISAVLYWHNINVQIRMKAKIKNTSKDYSDSYFKNRSKEKNALAICSNQSEEISSYDLIKSKYKKVLNNYDLTLCPEYWGGFSFTPFYFEFWEGNEKRLNKREAYKLIDNDWIKSILQP
jgi:pyridoxamine 5'-phosphate oxidase